MTEKSRRKVLKGLAVTLPAIWATPVVESVILPAHAAASCSENIEELCGDLPDTLEGCYECSRRVEEWGFDEPLDC